LDTKDYESAIAAFQNSLTTGFRDAELAYYNKGVAEINAKQKDAACKSFARSGSHGETFRAQHCR
jgi:hypothetical protein